MQNNQKYCTFYIVRHGQAQANVDKVVAGSTDTPLTAEGENQARARGEELSSIKFDAAFSSDLMRAHKTAQLIALSHQLMVNTTEIIRERHFGTWEGRLEKEALSENQHLFDKLKMLSEADKKSFKFNDGYESNDEIVARMLTFLREVAVAYPGKTVLVVSHGSIMRSLLIHLGFGLFDEFSAGCIQNTGYIKLETDGVDFNILETKGVTKTPLDGNSGRLGF